MRFSLSSPAPARVSRRGFTLIELLVSIVIIGILMALLIPAVGAVRRTAQQAQVRAEVSQLEAALADFKAKFNMYPPSRITLYEEADDWDDDAASRAIITQLWPQFDFTIDRNINGNAVAGETILLTGPECLVFFLGGIRNSEDLDSDGVLDGGEDLNGNSALDMLDGVSGFSANPANPFARGGSNRIGPFYEFNISRLIDTISNGALNLTGNGMYEMLDSLPGQTRPYAYASAYDGAGYRTSNFGGTAVDNLAGTGMVDVYRQTGSGSPPPAWNSKTFQLISPGFDGEYGTGGLFNPDTAAADFTAVPRQPERDNITNFHSGPLAP
jgi:general secretion pathway protein G